MLSPLERFLSSWSHVPQALRRPFADFYEAMSPVKDQNRKLSELARENGRLLHPYFLSRSFFSFLPVAARRVFASFGCVERRLLWMEACWATRRDVFVNPFLERSSPR